MCIIDANASNNILRTFTLVHMWYEDSILQASSSNNPPPLTNLLPLAIVFFGPTTLIEQLLTWSQKYENLMQFQMTWMPLFTWAKLVCEGDKITCIVCTQKSHERVMCSLSKVTICGNIMVGKPHWFQTGNASGPQVHGVAL